ncbi:MAG: methylenetetrahydrofolate reductase [NAD(P)H] [Gammaproteobacteria bacterium]
MLAANLNVPEHEANNPQSRRFYGHRPVRKAQDEISDMSFEFFPPSSDKAETRLWSTIDQLKALKPKMVSVTYGADGSTRDNTYSTVKRLLDETDLTVAPHLTCVGTSKGELRELAQQYWQDGVRHIVALRGDAPKSTEGLPPKGDRYTYCSEFVEDLRKVADFDISVAAYPETHPEALSPAKDLENLRRKFDAGATRAITQFFFANEHFLRFRDHCALFGIEGEIVPGILPVENFTQVQRFAKDCGTEIPKWLIARFAGLENDPATRKLLAASAAIEQVNDLKQHGVSQFHMYTLNRADITYAVGHALGVGPKTTSETV